MKVRSEAQLPIYTNCYFCNDLKLDWRYGACYFEEQLLDYDGWSNRGKWAYQAGVGNGSQRQLQF